MMVVWLCINVCVMVVLVYCVGLVGLVFVGRSGLLAFVCSWAVCVCCYLRWRCFLALRVWFVCVTC